MLSVQTPKTKLKGNGMLTPGACSIFADDLLAPPPSPYLCITPTARKPRCNYPDRFIPPRTNVFRENVEDMIPSPNMKTPNKVLDFNNSGRTPVRSATPNQQETKKQSLVDTEVTVVFHIPRLLNHRDAKPISFTQNGFIMVALEDRLALWNPRSKENMCFGEIIFSDRPNVVKCGETRDTFSQGVFGLQNGGVGVVDLEKFVCTWCDGSDINIVLDIDIPRHFSILSASEGGIFLRDARQDRVGLVVLDCDEDGLDAGGAFLSLKLFPDLRTVVTGCLNGKIYLIDLRMANTALAEFNAHMEKTTSEVSRVDFCPWNTDIISSSGYQDETVFLWDINTQMMKRRIKTGNKITDMAWSLSHQQLLTTHWSLSSPAQLFDFPSYKKNTILNDSGERAISCTVSSRGGHVAVATEKHRVKMWSFWRKETKKSSIRHACSPLRMSIR